MTAIATGVVHSVPADLKAALIRDKRALATWDGLTPLARNEWICWTVSCKKAETRIDHVQRVPKQLKEGKRRPCCWIGCIHRTDKAISPSIKGLLAARAKKGVPVSRT